MVKLRFRLGALALICATVCSACQKATELRDISTNLNDRKWVALQRNIRTGEGKDYTLELVPAESNKDTWREMVTVQYFWTGKKPVALSSVETEMMKRLSISDDAKKSSPNNFFAEWFGTKAEGKPGRKREISYHVISETPDERLFTWQAHNDPELQNQQGLVRVADTKEGVEVLQYTSKTQMPNEQVELWKKLLAESELQALVR